MIKESIELLNFCFLKTTNNHKKTIIYANKQFYNLIGYSEEEFKLLFNNNLSSVCYYNKNHDNLINKNTEEEFIIEEYYIIHKDGRKIYILDKTRIITENENEYRLTSFINISFMKENSLEYNSIKNKLYAILEDSDLYYWEYDLKNNKLISSNLENKFEDYNEIKENPLLLLKKNLIKNEYKREFIKMHLDLEKRCDKIQKTIRILFNNDYVLYLIKYNVFFDEQRKCRIAFGTAENVEKYAELENRFSTVIKNEGITTWTYNILDKTFTYQDSLIDGNNGKVIEDVPYCMLNEIHPEDRKRFLHLYNKVEKGDQVTSVKIRQMNYKNNTYDWYKVTYTTVFYKGNKPIKAIGIGVNINKEIEAEKQNTVLENYHNIISKNSIIYFKVNLDKNTINESEIRHDNIKNLEDNDSVDSLFESFLVLMPNINEKIKFKKTFSRDRLIMEFNEGNSSVKKQIMFVIDNRPMWVNVSVEMYKGLNSKDIDAIIYIEDINKETILSFIADKLLDVDYEIIATINVKTEETSLYNCQSDKLLYIPKESSNYSEENSRILSKIISKEQLDDAMKELSLKTIIKELEKSNTYERAYLVTYNNRNYYKNWKYVYLDDTKNTILFSRSDLTESYTKEQKKNKQLEKALKLANVASSAKSNFLSRMSHDIRTPMNGIIGLINMAYEKEMPDDVRTYLKKIEESSNYLLDLINDSLDMNKIESNKMEIKNEPVDSKEIFDTILSIIKPSLIEKNIKLNCDFNNVRFIPIKTDKNRIKQIFLNIFSNAVKFTPQGGKITIGIKEIEEDEFCIRNEFYIEDTGIGMTKDFLNHIFEPFMQENNYVNASTVGTGLGMAIVKKIINMMGGTIKINSVVNKGTKVIVTLLFEKATDYIKKEKTQIDIENINFKNKRILLVEDNQLNMEIAKHLLVKKECIVDVAENGKKAVEMFQAKKEYYYSCILMDIRMPIMDGIEATKQIRKLKKADSKIIPIIALTANAFSEELENTKIAGMNDYIAKPIQPNIFYNLIYKYINEYSERRD